MEEAGRHLEAAWNATPVALRQRRRHFEDIRKPFPFVFYSRVEDLGAPHQKVFKICIYFI